MKKKFLRLSLISMLLMMSFAQIAAQEDMMMDEVNLFATLNPADLANDAIINLSADLSTMNPVFADFADPVTSVQSIDFTSDGTAYVTFDAADGAGGITALSGLTGMDDMMMVDMMTPIMGANTGLTAPKGIEIIESLGVVLVANFGEGNIKAFSMDDSGDVLPAQVIGLGDTVGGSVWDILYVEETDTLYAAGTAGDILAYDDFSNAMGNTGPTRVIAPSNGDLEKVTINLHALVYVADQDTLIVSDVGAADDATDGHLYAVSDASTADGNTTVSLHILGPESMLGNPVDLVWDGSGLYVAEKANDAILYFGGLLDMGGMMDTTPTAVIEATKPESLAIYQPDMMMDDSAMGDDEMMDDMMMDVNLFASLNPADLANDAIINLSSDLSTMNPVFAEFADPVTSVQSIDFTSDGTAYVTFDAADGAGGITALSGLTGMDDMMMVDMMAPILGANTGLSSPKGIEVIESLGIVLVANVGGGNILAFPMDASGDVEPARTIVGGTVWDILYVEETDTLYATGTSGDILAYDDFSNAMGDAGPTRVISPSNGDLEKVTINLHGLVYVADQDTLIVSDVGAADDATDGHLYAVPAISDVNGNVTVSLHILGQESMLGNPVDLAWDGSGLYVAEKANDVILYFGGLLDMGGMMDTTPTAVIEASKPESLAFYDGGM